MHLKNIILSDTVSVKCKPYIIVTFRHFLGTILKELVYFIDVKLLEEKLGTQKLST